VAPIPARLVGRCLLAAALASLLPGVLWAAHLPILGSTGGPRYEVVELFGFTTSLAIIALAWPELRRLRAAGAAELVPVVLPLLAALLFLTHVSEHSVRSPDYRDYERASQAIVAGQDPYQYGRYLYPPLPGQALAGAFGALDRATRLAGKPQSPEVLWDGVFFLTQCAQYFLLLATWFLLYRLGQTLGFDRASAAALVTVLLVVSNPTFRLLKFNQVNLWVVDTLLLGTLWLRARPFAAGLVVALGAHIKLYPALLLAYWAALRRWAAVAGGVVGLALLALATSGGGRDWTVWGQFVRFAPSFPKGGDFRDNGLHAVVRNLLRFGARIADRNDPWLLTVTGRITAVLTLAVLAWFAWRFVRRERVVRSWPEDAGEQAATWRVCGHLADAVGLALLVAPIVWEHHYLLALPLVVFAAAVAGRERPWPVALGWFLMFALPTFDVFPLSWHRLAGLLLMLWVTGPERAHGPWSPPRLPLAT